MAITVAQLLVKLNADTTGMEAGFGRAAKMLGPAGPLAVPLGLAIAGVAALGAISIKMAGDFQASTETLVTGAGESQAALGKVRDGILQMARDTGTSTKQLTDGMFMIDSAGFTLAKGGLTVLRAAAEGAKVQNADLGTVADAVTTVLNDYGLGAQGAAYATNILVATVKNGKTHMQDLAGSISHVLPTAAAYHVKLTDVAAALATMTAAGVPAADAATYLRQTLIGLGSPTSAAAKALASVGLSTEQVNDSMKKSLPATLKMITDAVGKHFPAGSVQYNEAIKAIAGGSKQMQGMLDLTGAHMQTFINDAGNISGAAAAGGKSIAGWSDVQKTFNFQFDRAKEVVLTLMIQLGQKLLPVATALFGFIADKAIPALQHFSQWVSGNSASAQIFKVVLIAVGGAIAAVLVTAFVSWAIAAGAAAIATLAAMAPVLLIGAAIALLIVGIKLLLDHWKQVSDWLQNVWNGVVTGVGNAFSGLGTLLHNVWGGIQTSTKNFINVIISDINSFIGFLDNIQIHIPSVGVGPVHTPAFDWNGLGIPQIPMLAAGGIIRSGGTAVLGDAGPELVNLPTGARVTPLSGPGPSAGAAVGAGMSQTIIVQLDGRTITQAVVKHLPGQVRLSTGARSF